MFVHGRGVIGSDVKAFESHEGAAYCAGDPMGVHGFSVNAERPDATLAEVAAIVDGNRILWLPALASSFPPIHVHHDDRILLHPVDLVPLHDAV